jgi:hypothetical protein
MNKKLIYEQREADSAVISMELHTNISCSFYARAIQAPQQRLNSATNLLPLRLGLKVGVDKDVMRIIIVFLEKVMNAVPDSPIGNIKLFLIFLLYSRIKSARYVTQDFKRAHQVRLLSAKSSPINGSIAFK